MHFFLWLQVNMQKMFLGSFLMKQTPFMCVPTLSRIVLTAWPSRSPSWTLAWKRVSPLEICYCLMLYIKPVTTSCCFAVSLQDINMRKAFKSSTVQDQQVLSKGSMSNSVAYMYNNSNRPPPLSTLTTYRYHMCCKK